MALNPCMLTQDVDVSWDGGRKHMIAGTIVDIPPGSALEAAYGLGNIVRLSDQDAAAISNGVFGSAAGLGDGS